MKKVLLALTIFSMLTIAAANTDTIYIVQPGDTLFRIALKFGVSQAAIMNANGLTNPNIIYAGQRLVIPSAPLTSNIPAGTPSGIGTGGGTTYTVKSGDTLFRIAATFNVTVAALKTANGLNSNWIYAGQTLIIPGTTGQPLVLPTPAATVSAPAGSTYLVRPGDTLWRIATNFRITVTALKTANGLIGDRIYPGQQLIIPPITTTTGPAITPVASTAGGAFELGGQVSGFTTPDKMKYAGMTWVKRQLKWSPGAAASADWINEAHARGFKILLSVIGATPDTIANGANYDAYAAYVGELARLGADGIEVWNEMNIDREWPTGQINPSAYADLLRRAYTRIKAGNASTLVISGAPAPTGAEGAFGRERVWNDDSYVAGLAAAGAAAYADCIGVHYNEGIISPTRSSGDPRDNYFTRYYSGMVNTYYNAFGGARKLCFTELGYLSGEGYGPLPPAFAWANNTTVSQQAQWLGEAVSLARAGGKVRLLIVFNVDFTSYGDDPQAGYAILRPNGTCPACDTLRQAMGVQ